jgi:enolase
MIALSGRLVTAYPIVAIEDGVAEDDQEGWVQLTKVLGDRVMLVGDGVFVTNPVLIRQGVEARIANAVLITGGIIRLTRGGNLA